MKAIAIALVLAAPLQCGGAHPDVPREETAPEALYGLAQRFHQRGEDQAYRETLGEVVERFPSSRWAERARVELDGGAP
jgi:TolA-binding protein